MTNQAWVISASRVRDALGLRALHLVNDFVAQSMAIRLLQGDDVVAIGPHPRPTAPAPSSRTIAVIGTGPDRCYPAGNAALMERIAASGAVVTEHPPGTAGIRQHQLELLDETDASGLPVWRREEGTDLTGLPVWAAA